MVMMNQLVELPSHIVTLRLVAPMAAAITNAEATAVDRKHKTINQPSDTFNFPSSHVTNVMRHELAYGTDQSVSTENRMTWLGDCSIGRADSSWLS
jgi:hypothetical protein